MGVNGRRRGQVAWAGLALPEVVLLGALIAWSFVVVVHLLAELHGGSLTGADGPFPADQLQYLAWMRDSGTHGLAGDLFEIPRGARVFVQPMWLLSGLLWRAGASLPVAMFVWKPLVAVALALGIRAYVARMIADLSAVSRSAVVLLAVGYSSPFLLLTNRGSSLAGEMFSAGQLWGYLPSVLAVALMPVYLLLLERAMSVPARPRAGTLLGLGGSAALVGWLHPWQGETLLLLTAGLVIWRRAWRSAPLLIGLGASALPLAGYFALAHLDPSWRTAQAAENISSGSFVDLVIALAPLAVLAATGLRQPAGDLQEQALLLWPAASVATFAVLAPSFPGHSLEGIAIPLAVMSARGLLRVRLPEHLHRSHLRGAPLGLAVGALVLTIPGVANSTHFALRLVGDGRGGQIIDPSERSALRYLASLPGSGGVLAPATIGAAVPAFTGRPTWVGHPAWTPDYNARYRLASAVSKAALPPPAGRAAVQASRARYVLVGCGSPDLAELLGPLMTSSHRFGCATVYTLR